MYLGKIKLYNVYILTHTIYGSSFCTNTQSNKTNLWDGHRRPNWFQYGSSDYYQSCVDIVKLYFGWFTSRWSSWYMTIIIGQFVCLGFCSSSFFMLPGASPMLLENMPNGVNLWLLASFIFYFLEFEKSCCPQLLVVLDPECNPVDPNPLQSITLFPGSFAGSVFARNIHRAAAPHNALYKFSSRGKELTEPRIYNSIATGACNPCHTLQQDQQQQQKQQQHQQ